MALRTIRLLGDDILTKTCREVKVMTPRLQELIADGTVQSIIDKYITAE